MWRSTPRSGGWPNGLLRGRTGPADDLAEIIDHLTSSPTYVAASSDSSARSRRLPSNPRHPGHGILRWAGLAVRMQR